MKKYILSIVAVLTLAIASGQANLVTITWAPQHSPTGGAFVMTPQNGASFETFCVDTTHYISLGGTYNYTVDNLIHGVSPLSLGTAWLYSNFRDGTLSGFTGTSAQDTDLQNAFWYLQGEITGQSANPWVELADANLGNTVENAADGAYGVDVWNLTDSSGNLCQSQLGFAPVPEPGTWWVGLAMFLPFGLATMRRFRRLPTI